MLGLYAIAIWLPIASFPSNELNTPILPEVLASGVILLGLLYMLFRIRSVGIGLVMGALATACIAGYLLWPRVLREPRAPNPGPSVVIVAAIAGGCFGAASAIVGTVIHRFFSHDATTDKVSNDIQ